MEFYVYNKLFELQGIIDIYNSALWVSRYFTSGDFELKTNYTDEKRNILKIGNFIVRNTDISGNVFNNVMRIENIEITINGDGMQITASGRDLKSITGQRVIANQTEYRGSLQECLHVLIFDALIEPTNANRKIDNFMIERADISEISDVEILNQVKGENLQEYIEKASEQYGIGWEAYVNNGNIILRMKEGADRSAEQYTNPRIIFSPAFNNLTEINYQNFQNDYKNAVVIAGEGDGIIQIVEEVGESAGLDRFEMYQESKAKTNAGNIDETDYRATLQTEGLETVSQYTKTEMLDTENDFNLQFIINRDFYLGDLVTVSDGRSNTTARVTEVIYSIDETGEKEIPTLTKI